MSAVIQHACDMPFIWALLYGKCPRSLQVRSPILRGHISTSRLALAATLRALHSDKKMLNQSEESMLEVLQSKVHHLMNERGRQNMYDVYRWYNYRSIH